MNPTRLLVFTALLTAGLSTVIPAQQVYRCKLADGSITFSDLPCESDIGHQDRVDATPHQGHRSSSAPAQSVEKRSGAPRDEKRRRPGNQDRRGGAGAEGRGESESDELTRRQRLRLERERKALLSGLKRRHIAEEEIRAMIRGLREIDRQLGLGPADVADMPFHDRDVYEEHGIYPRRSAGAYRQ